MKSAKRVAAFLTATALVFSFSPAVFAEDPWDLKRAIRAGH